MKKLAIAAVLISVAALLVCAIAWDPAGMMEKLKSRYMGRMNPPSESILDAARARLSPLLAPETAFHLPGVRIEIDKKARRATLYSGEKVVKVYPIVLGGNPVGHKLVSGDSRTPEGNYHICTRVNPSKYHLFMGINYPNAADARDALTSGTITAEVCETMVKAEASRQRPNWETPMGGAIGLHGGGVDNDWTAGCIAFENEAIEEIWVATDYWTPVMVK